MGHSNSTTNYSLPQFASTDKPAWLTDVNSAYSAIDTAMKNNADAASAAQGDATQALTDAGNALTAANTADGKGTGAVSSIAPAFDSTSTYAVGALVMYNNLLYICTTAVTTPGPWTGVTNWSRVYIESVIPKNLDDLNDVDISNSPEGKILKNVDGKWEDADAPELNDFIKVSFEVGTTTGTGILQKTFAHNVIVLCAWATRADCIVDCYIEGTNDETGAATWNFYCHNTAGQTWGNTNMTLRMAYIDYNA